ncbi:MAG TPA: hypothetical protein VFV78_14070 [Vicinamibacterales bacterium]|nr:hypothetical protein [Vicinamibacterales bacterium]
MQRSAGVLAVAVATLIGSILVLGLGILTAGFALVAPAVPQPEGKPPLPIGGALLFGSLVYILPGIWGVVSGIGLLRLKNWARVSTIVFAVFAAFAGAGLVLALLMLLRMSVPQDDGPNAAAIVRTFTVVRLGTGILSIVLLSVAMWFGILLTRPSVGEQFGETEGRANRRPLSITVIAVLMFITAPFIGLGLLTGAPAAFFLTMLTGPPAVGYWLAMAGILVFCGWGLLRTMRMARILAIAYFVFAILSSGVFFLAPGRDARMAALMSRQAIVVPSPDEGPQLASPVRAVMAFGFVGGLVAAAVPLYFLIANRAAFEATHNAGQTPD